MGKLESWNVLVGESRRKSCRCGKGFYTQRVVDGLSGWGLRKSVQVTLGRYCSGEQSCLQNGEKGSLKGEAERAEGGGGKCVSYYLHDMMLTLHKLSRLSVSLHTRQTFHCFLSGEAGFRTILWRLDCPAVGHVRLHDLCLPEACRIGTFFSTTCALVNEKKIQAW